MNRLLICTSPQDWIYWISCKRTIPFIHSLFIPSQVTVGPGNLACVTHSSTIDLLLSPSSSPSFISSFFFLFFSCPTGTGRIRPYIQVSFYIYPEKHRHPSVSPRLRRNETPRVESSPRCPLLRVVKRTDRVRFQGPASLYIYPSACKFLTMAYDVENKDDRTAIYKRARARCSRA